MRFYIITLFVALFALFNVASARSMENGALAKRKITAMPYTSPAILQDGTLFWIGLAVTCALWTTGKAIDVKLQRQERHAENVAQSI